MILSHAMYCSIFYVSDRDTRKYNRARAFDRYFEKCTYVSSILLFVDVLFLSATWNVIFTWLWASRNKVFLSFSLKTSVENSIRSFSKKLQWNVDKTLFSNFSLIKFLRSLGNGRIIRSNWKILLKAENEVIEFLINVKNLVILASRRKKLRRRIIIDDKSNNIVANEEAQHFILFEAKFVFPRRMANGVKCGHRASQS